HLPRVGAVEILLKRGRADNELNRYRYDVLLHVCKPSDVEELALDWDDMTSITDVARRLESRPAVLRIRSVTNCVLTRDPPINKRVESSEGNDSLKEVISLMSTINEAPTEDLETFWILGGAYNYDVRPTWTSGSLEGRFDVLLIDRAQVPSAVASANGRLES